MDEPHQLLPAAIDAERSVLCSLLLAPVEVAHIYRRSGLKPHHFHLPAHADLFKIAMAKIENDEVFDVVTLTNTLRIAGKLDMIGGPAYLTSLYSEVPTAANALYYAEIILEKWALRQIIRANSNIAERALQNEEPELLLAEMLRNAEEIKEYRQNITQTEAQIAIQTVKNRIGARLVGGHVGVSTGVETWDQNIGTLIPGMIIIAARQKMGKTALMEQITRHLNSKLGIATVIFERDMSPADLYNRIACREANVIHDDFMHNKCDLEQIKRVRIALDLIDPNLFRLYSPSNMTTGEIRATIRREMMERNVGAVFIDSFLKIKWHGRDMTQGFHNVSVELQDIQAEFKIPLVIIAHLNRDSDGRKRKGKDGKEDDGVPQRPNSSDIKWCDQLKSDADLVLLLWSKDIQNDCFYHDTKTGDRIAPRRRHMVLSVADARGGPEGDHPMWFDGPMMRFHGSEKN